MHDMTVVHDPAKLVPSLGDTTAADCVTVKYEDTWSGLSQCEAKVGSNKSETFKSHGNDTQGCRAPVCEGTYEWSIAT